MAPGPGISSYSAGQLALPRHGVPSASILMTGSRTCFPLKDAHTRWRFYVWEMGQKAFFIAKNHASNLSFLEDPDEEQTSGFNAVCECPEQKKADNRQTTGIETEQFQTSTLHNSSVFQDQSSGVIIAKVIHTRQPNHITTNRL